MANRTTLYVYALGAAVVAGLSGFALGRGTDFGIEFTAPGGYSVKMKVDGKFDPFQVMGALLNDSSMSGAAHGWLAQNEHMVPLTKSGLAQALDDAACADFGTRQKIASLPLKARLDTLRACAEKPANAELRHLAFKRKPRGYPFHPVGVPTLASVPGDEPPRGFVSVCENDFRGRRLELIRAEEDQSIFVEGSGKITDCSDVRVSTQLHLNGEDAAELFGFEPVEGKHTLYVSIVPSN